MMRVLLDTNVVLDVLQKREPWFQDGAVIFRAIANNQVTGCLTAKQITDIHFFARKQFKGNENVDGKARQVIGKLLSLFDLIDTLGIDCRNAIGINNGDFEDAVLIESTLRAGIDRIVTRNLEHFRPCPVQVCSPSEFAGMLKNLK